MLQSDELICSIGSVIGTTIHREWFESGGLEYA